MKPIPAAIKALVLYRLAKLRFLPQQLLAVVVFGLALTLASHFFKREDERTWARDAGHAIVGFAVTRWLTQQGRRRTDERGLQLRKNTMRFKPPQEDGGE